MVRLLRSLAVILPLVSAPFSGPWAAECTKVVYSAHPEYPPFHWRNGRAVEGASVQITAQILAELGIPGEPVFVGPWPRVLKSAEHGEIDLIVALKDTPERRRYLEFTATPVFDNPMAVFVRSDADWAFGKWEDLIGRRGGVNAGDRYGGGFDEFLADRLSIEAADTLDSNFSKLLAGRIDYFVTGLHTGREFLHSRSLDAVIRPMPVPVTSGYIHNGFSARSPCRALIGHFNRRLKEMREDGTTDAVLQANILKWRSGS